ncbi:unnamed protein product [Euphydryas editha]|uniref:Uncharacterized protein n=1 Tax=Euphydryas editha TaxID=104508 RepID=A0AAU9UHR6_EUPED|nr:unnamed protein product [Euphydryas editha]
MTWSEEDSNSSEGDSPPMKRRAGNGATVVHETFWDCFNEVAQDNSQTEDTTNSAIANELDFYLKMRQDLFMKIGEIVCYPKNAENLVFIHHNLPLVNYEY